MSKLDPSLTSAFEAGYQAANENARQERGDMQATIDGVQEELRELGVAFENLQRAAKEAATSLRTMASIMGGVSYDEANQVAEDLEDAAGVAK